jgi:hypothetical protein
MKMPSWLESWFSQPGQGVLRMLARRMIAPGTYETLPTAGAAFRYGIAADASGVQVCQPDGAGWSWQLAGLPDGLRILSGSATWDPASFNDDQVVTVSVTVTGVAVGDPCFAGYSSIGAQNILLEAHVSGADTVQVLLYNASAGAQNPGSGTVNVICFDGM